MAEPTSTTRCSGRPISSPAPCQIPRGEILYVRPTLEPSVLSKRACPGRAPLRTSQAALDQSDEIPLLRAPSDRPRRAPAVAVPVGSRRHRRNAELRQPWPSNVAAITLSTGKTWVC
ncbi:hypothetical protein M6B38_343745 [Iris pallida]|uniref:Uncharacterized protein n=1 Tax=Iris pallida TaxID=29817 RepID=A0AAX6GUN5_IRIPA|nr:hypothetical protein M6B38_343745 [Iris pallida]